MSRQNQVVRADGNAGPAAFRDFNSTVIHCTGDSCSRTWYGAQTIGAIWVDAAEPYQRFYVSATLNAVRAWTPPQMFPALAKVHLSLGGGGDFAQIDVPPMDSGFNMPACITGAIDIRGGFGSIELRILPAYWGNGAAIAGFTMQVIEGQIVDQPGCGVAGGCA